MDRFGIVTSGTPSLMAVAEDMMTTFERLGYKVKTFHRQIPHHTARELFDRAIVFIPFDPLYCPGWFLLQRDYAIAGIPSVVYTTVEGEPKKHLVRDWFKRDCSFIAVSKFVERMLSRVGVKCRGVIYHGVNLDLIDQLKENAKRRKEHFKKVAGVNCLFGTVATSHKRKALDLLAKAIAHTQDRIRKAGFIIHTNPGGERFFMGLNNVYVSKDFGRLTRDEVLSLIGSFDFYIHPSLTEGFGLPILESSAFGVPSIYPEYEPITEFSPPALNYTCMVTEERWENFGDGIIYYCRYYRPEELGDRIIEAYEDYTRRRGEYKDRSEELKEQAKKFDIMNTYGEFVSQDAKKGHI